MTSYGPERIVEKYLKDELERYGFKVIKFVPQGFAGAPDRWVFRPKWSPGEPCVVEVKAAHGKLRKLQFEAASDLMARGVKVLDYINDKEGVDELVVKLVGEAVWYIKPQDRANLPNHIRAAWQRYNRKNGL